MGKEGGKVGWQVRGRGLRRQPLLAGEGAPCLLGQHSVQQGDFELDFQASSPGLGR